MNKKKKITILVCTLFMVFSLGACGKTKEDAAVVTQQESSLQIESMDEETTSEESTTFNNGKEDDIELKDTIEIDFTYDYTEDIKADVAYVVSNSSSLQEELKNIDTITQKYTLLAESAQTQGEMNVASQWLYMIWDTELNNLWSRFSSLANQDTKEMVLEEQRNWIAMKEEVTLMSLGSQEENGSMYPMLVNSLWEEKTKNRAYFIANELAQIEGESFAMPEASTKYGLVLKNGTSDSRKEWFAVGDYKKLPNEVGGRDTALPEEVADKMKALLTEYNAKEEKTFEDILDFHVKFERIHPFQDGNGRVGRLIIFKECLKYNIVPFIIEDDLKMFYYRGLKEWDSEKGYLTDNCLTAQDKYKVYLDYFRIAY